MNYYATHSFSACKTASVNYGQIGHHQLLTSGNQINYWDKLERLYCQSSYNDLSISVWVNLGLSLSQTFFVLVRAVLCL